MENINATSQKASVLAAILLMGKMEMSLSLAGAAGAGGSPSSQHRIAGEFLQMFEHAVIPDLFKLIRDFSVRNSGFL